MHPTEQTINDYVDGALAPEARAEIERHLAACGECRLLAADLREIERTAAALEPADPPAHVWARIETAVRRAGPEGRTPPLQRVADRLGLGSPVVRGWAAVAAALIVATLVGLRFGPLAHRTGGTASPAGAPATETAAGAADPNELTQSVESELLQAEQHYQKAISGLEQITAAGQGALDPGTAATVQKNLEVIDRAIAESRAALKAQPASEPAQDSLLESFKTKIMLLQDTVALINEMRRGNQAGAAEIASGLKQKG